MLGLMLSTPLVPAVIAEQICYVFPSLPPNRIDRKSVLLLRWRTTLQTHELNWKLSAVPSC